MIDVDRLLAEDGARWRATQPAPPDPDATLLTRARRPRWQPLAAAAAALAIIAGAVTFAVTRSASAPAPTAPAGPSPGPVVRDGDRVTGNVVISAMPGRGVRICGGATTRGDAVTPDGKLVPGTPAYCTNGYTVTGVDLDRLSDRRVLAGTVIGSARITGVYRAGTVAVTDQRAPTKDTRPPLIRLPDDCPAPAGGWPRTNDVTQAEVDRVVAYTGRHRGFGVVTLARLDPAARRPIVVLVTTTGDVATAVRGVRTVYDGLLCIRRARYSEQDALAARAALTAPMNNSATVIRYRITGGGGTPQDAGGAPYVDLRVLIWTEDVEAFHRTFGSVVKVLPALTKVP